MVEFKKNNKLKGRSITLVNPAHGTYAAHASPPLWMAYLQSVLRQSGAEVRMVDEAAGQKIGVINTDWVGFTVTTPVSGRVYSLCEELRRSSPNTKIMLGGPHVTIFPEEGLKHSDKVIAGEGELSVLRLFSSREKILRSPLVKDINSIPFPDWSGLPLKQYASFTRKHPYLSVMTSRGCPFSCIFCYKGIFGRMYRARSPENVLNELGHLKQEYGIKEIAFIDDNFTALKNRTEEICNGMIERKLGLEWTCPNGIRVDTVDKPLLQLMRSSGCYQLSFGIESGNQEVLNKIGKHIQLGQVRNAIKWAKESGIQTIGFFMIALPFDTEDTMGQTIALAKELNCDYSQFTITTPYPGTKLYDLVQAEGELLIKDFSKYGSYSGKAYYKYGELEPALVERMYKRAIRELYMRPSYLLKKAIANPGIIIAGLRYMFKRSDKN